jgi:hypothetical protein
MAIRRMAFLLTHLPGFGENQWCLGVRSCLPLRGSSGFAPDSLKRFPWKRHQQAIHNIKYAIFRVNLNVVVL